ncbi:MAG: crossover junction endodeoxyribonuclease RuvC [Candidatus Acidiferrum sp.]
MPPRVAIFIFDVTFDWNQHALRLRLTGMNDSLSSKDAPSCLRVLGVDPAAAGPTGYAIIEQECGACRVLHYGAFRVAAKRQKSSSGAALQDVHALLCELITEFKPHIMAVESVFTALNMRTALRLAEIRGVVLLAGQQLGVEVRSYTPREIKASVAGYGHADKKQMQAMVKAQLRMKEVPEPSDAADALAVALCHLQTDRLERRFGVKKADLAGTSRSRTPKGSTTDGYATSGPGVRVQPSR